MNTNVLCIDIGSTSLKAALISKKGVIKAYCRQDITNGDNAAEYWLSALAEGLKTFPLRKINAVCISGNGPTIVSSSGKTLLWNVGLKQPDEQPAAPHKLPPHSFLIDNQPALQSLFIPRLKAFKERFLTTWQQDAYFLGAPEYLIWKLTGKALTILPEDRFKPIYWTETSLADAGFTAEEIAKLPPFAYSTSLAGEVTKDAARLTGIKAGTRVFCGAPDFIAALVGTNTLHSGNMCDRAGTSEGINLCTPLPLTGATIRTLPSIIPGLWNASILIPNSGARFAAYKAKVEFQTKKAYSYQMLTEELIKHGGGHLPIPLAVEGRSLIENLGRGVQKAVATLTYAAFRTHVLTPEGKADESIPLPDEMYLSGGQARSEPWVEYKCTIADITCKTTTCIDAELMGDNILARVGMGEYSSIQEAADALVVTEKTYFPSTAEL